MLKISIGIGLGVPKVTYINMVPSKFKGEVEDYVFMLRLAMLAIC